MNGVYLIGTNAINTQLEDKTMRLPGFHTDESMKNKLVIVD